MTAHVHQLKTDAVFVTDTPARLDRLPWSRFHTLVVFALGITWILDGLEVTLVGALSPAIAGKDALNLSATQIGLLGSAYTSGAVIGALVFGRLTDRLGRKRLFTLTVLVYLLATLASGCAWNFWSLAAFRFLTGAGIGGEYSAVNSTIQELVPARRRGVVDLAINGSFWVGAGIGASGAIFILDPSIISQVWGWRLAFLGGGVLSAAILFVRRLLPESPRWLMTHGRPAEAEQIVAQIEAGVAREHGIELPRSGLARIKLRARQVRLRDLWSVLIDLYPARTFLGVILMTTQAFCYNAIFFTYALMLTHFFAVPAAQVGWFMLPFAAGNFLGPLLLGPLFDSVGRRTMIAMTYGASGVLLAIAGVLFAQGAFTAVTLTIAWTIIFFFASAAASAAYLTVGECFPLETRAIGIGVFYAFGTALGGIAGPALFGMLIDSGEPWQILQGYLVGGALMVTASIAALVLGVDAEGRSLEEVAPPLSQTD